MMVCNNNFDPAAPLTVKVREHVLGQIRRGVWRVGQHLPSVRELAERLDVSTTVVFLAVKDLRDEQIVEKRANGRHVIGKQAEVVLGGSKSLRVRGVKPVFLSADSGIARRKGEKNGLRLKVGTGVTPTFRPGPGGSRS